MKLLAMGPFQVGRRTVTALRRSPSGLRALRNALSLLLCLIVIASRAPAAPPQPVQWSVGNVVGSHLSPGAKFTVILAAAIEPGWHLYALEEPEGGPQPTEIALAEGDPVTLLSVDQGKSGFVADPVSRQLTAFFEHRASFTLHLQLPPTMPRPATVLHVTIRYQSCNDKMCLPPRTDRVEVPLARLL